MQLLVTAKKVKANGMRSEPEEELEYHEFNSGNDVRISIMALYLFFIAWKARKLRAT